MRSITHTPLVLRSRPLRAALMVVALTLVTACARDIVTVQMGSVSLNVTSSASVAGIDSWRVTIDGPSGSQVRQGSPGSAIEFGDLQPGSYRVLLEGFDGADLASQGESMVVVQSGRTATASISLAPVLPVITLAADDPDASEVGLDPGRVTVMRAGPASTAVVVNLSLSGSATPGLDYQPINTAVTLAAGQRSAVVDVIPIQDAVQEGPEAVVFAIAQGNGYEIGSPPTAAVTIADTPLGTIAFSPSPITMTAVEGAPSPAATTVTVLNTMPGSVLNGLTVGPIQYLGGASGWLSATLTATTAPPTLTLQASTTTLAAGTYIANVPVLSSSASNSGEPITVTLIVNSPGVLYGMTTQRNLSTFRTSTGTILTSQAGAGFADVGGFCGDGGSLYTFENTPQTQPLSYLYRITPFNASGSTVGALGVTAGNRACDVDRTTGVLYAVLDVGGVVGLYTVNTATGAASRLATIAVPTSSGGTATLTALAISPSGEAFVSDFETTSVGATLYRLSLSTGTLTFVGRVPGVTRYTSLTFDATGQLWGYAGDNIQKVYTINTTTAARTFAFDMPGTSYVGISFRW